MRALCPIRRRGCSRGGAPIAQYVRHSGWQTPDAGERTVAQAVAAPATRAPAHQSTARPKAESKAPADRYASGPIPASSGSAATASSPAARAAALLIPLARPARPAGTEASTVAVSGATSTVMPAPITTMAGRTSRTYEASGPTRSISSVPAAHSSGPTVSGKRGPIRSPRAPAREDSSSIRAVVGSSAAPAPRAEYPDTTWSWSTTRKKKPPKAA